MYRIWITKYEMIRKNLV